MSIARMSITFDNAGDFAATNAAEDWLRLRGFSAGSMQMNAPRAIWHGDCYVSKWRGLSAKDKAEMHAILEGDGRTGPVTIRLCNGATLEAKAAFQREPA